MRLTKQYNPIVDSYEKQIKKMNKKSISEFKKALFYSNSLIKGKKVSVLDMGCGAGDLYSYCKKLNLNYFGVDSSKEMVSLAKKKTGADIRVEDFSKTSFKNDNFDLIISKWAIQTTDNIEKVYSECSRILKPKGIVLILVTHPMRQFLEKKKNGKNYFKQEMVKSVIFNGSIIVKEPSHTMQDYFSNFFLGKFNLLMVKESYEFPGAEQIGGDIYPTHLIFVAQKK